MEPAPATTQVWHSYDVAVQSDPAQQGVVSGNGSTPATIEFYQWVNDLGVDKGSLFSQYNPGNHPNAATAATTYWANGTGAVYPYAGKSTVGRGSEPGKATCLLLPGSLTCNCTRPTATSSRSPLS